MSTGRKVGILAILILFGGIAAYWMTQDDAAGPRVSSAQTPGDQTPGESGPAGVHENDPSMTRDAGRNDEPTHRDDRASDVLDALRATASPSGGGADTDTEPEPTDDARGTGVGGREASAADAASPGALVEGATDEEAIGEEAMGEEAADDADGGVAWPMSDTGEDVGHPSRVTYPPDTDLDPFSMDDLPAEAVAAEEGPGEGETDPADEAEGDGADEAGAVERDAGFTPTRWVQRTEREEEEPALGAPAREDEAETETDGAAPAGGRMYTVESGDSLWVIASKTLGSGAKWQKIADANPEIDKNTVLRPGMKIVIPDGEMEGDAGRIPEPRQVTEPSAADPLGLGLNRDVREVTVRENESLWTIAEREYGDGTKWRVIHLANRDRMDDAQDLHPGDKLRVPPLPEDD